MAEKFLKPYETLFKKAKVDLNVAKLTLSNYELGQIELDLEVVFFHLQQSSEKLIKSILDINNIKFPHTHDIENLNDLLINNNIKIKSDIISLIPLSDYAVEGRYSVLHDDIEDASVYIKILETFINEVKNKIKVEK